jgi:uncharacterized phage protein (TIGR01671 family)
MREYKFRGKRKDNGEWVYGYYFIEERDIEDGIIWRDIPQIQQRYGDHFQYFDVDLATVGQYTGLKDKNGKEIYEGDVVRLFGGEYCRGYYEHDQTIVVKSAYDIVAMEESENVQLLGNRWDNPELLKEGSV